MMDQDTNSRLLLVELLHVVGEVLIGSEIRSALLAADGAGRRRVTSRRQLHRVAASTRRPQVDAEFGRRPENQEAMAARLTAGSRRRSGGREGRRGGGSRVLIRGIRRVHWTETRLGVGVVIGETVVKVELVNFTKQDFLCQFTTILSKQFIRGELDDLCATYVFGWKRHFKHACDFLK